MFTYPNALFLSSTNQLHVFVGFFHFHNLGFAWNQHCYHRADGTGVGTWGAVVYGRPKYLAKNEVFYYSAFVFGSRSFILNFRPFGFVFKMGHYPLFLSLNADRLIRFDNPKEPQPFFSGTLILLLMGVFD